MSLKNQKVVLPGGSGYIGRHLSRHFVAKGYDVVVLSRSEGELSDCLRYVWWDGANLDAWANEIDGADVVINLSGRSINCRYTKKNRQQIYDSRENSTQVVGEAITQAKEPPRVWLNASAATIYRHSLDRDMDEATGELQYVEPGRPKDKWEFSVDVVNRWEEALFNADTSSTRRIAMRLSMVFGTGSGGVFEAFRKITRLGLSGTQGSGNQFVSWLHIEDFLRMVDWSIENENIKGPINMCAPNPLPNREFLTGLRNACGVKLGLPAASWMLEIGAFFMRTETELLLKSRRVVPGKLLESGFKFNHPKWPEAAQSIESDWSNAL